MTNDLEHIGDAFKEVLESAAKKNEKVITKTLQKAPADFQRAAIKFYPTVLKRRSGNLVRSIQGFIQKTGDNIYEIGLRAGGEVASYAGAQHEGANIPRRFIAPRVAKALSWMQGGKRRFSKGHSVKGFRLKAKKYLEKPLIAEANKITKELLKKIGL